MRPIAALVVAALVAEGTALAQSRDDDRDAEGAVVADVSRGLAMPWTALARHDGAAAIVTVQGGWDAARDSAVFESAAEWRLTGRVAVRGGAIYLAHDDALAPVVSASVDALREERHGLDLAILGGYEAEGFNLTPAVATRVALGRTLGATRLSANVGLGLGTAEGERYGDLRLSAVRRLLRSLYVGVDSRGRVDLERDADEPPGETDWEIVAGPVVAYTLGRVVVSAGAGVAAFQPRLVGDREIGVQMTAGVSTAFP